MAEFTLRGLGWPSNADPSGWANEFPSTDPKKTPMRIESVYIHPDSDIFNLEEEFVGLMVYLCKGKNDFQLNSVHSETGTVYIKRSDWLLKMIKPRRRRGKYIHGRLFYSIFGCWKRKSIDFVGAGFAYHNGTWKWNSGTLNTMHPNNNDDTYHNTNRKLNLWEEKILATLVTHHYINHQWLSRASSERISFDALKRLADRRKSLSTQMKRTGVIEVPRKRKLQGTVVWFDYQIGYGFLHCSGVDKKIFVHHSAIFNSKCSRSFLKRNDKVEFYLIETAKGSQAREVTVS